MAIEWAISVSACVVHLFEIVCVFGARLCVYAYMCQFKGKPLSLLFASNYHYHYHHHALLFFFRFFHSFSLSRSLAHPPLFRKILHFLFCVIRIHWGFLFPFCKICALIHRFNRFNSPPNVKWNLASVCGCAQMSLVLREHEAIKILV